MKNELVLKICNALTDAADKAVIAELVRLGKELSGELTNREPVVSDQPKAEPLPTDQTVDATTNVIAFPKTDLVEQQAVKPTKPTVVEFCSGIGGNRLAFGDYFDVIASSEILPSSIQTYKDNFGDEPGHQLGDLTKLKPEQIPQADGYMISSPCQAFSLAGKRRGLKDNRGQVLLSFFDLVRKNKPEFFFIENVEGMKSSNGGRDFRTILTAIKQMGYTARFEVLKASDFGVPQNRKRLFIVAFLNDVKFDFPNPWLCDPKSKDILEEKVDEHYFYSQERSTKRLLDGKEIRKRVMASGSVS